MRAPVQKDGAWWLQGENGEWYIWNAASGSWEPAATVAETTTTQTGSGPSSSEVGTDPESSAPMNAPATSISTTIASAPRRRSAPFWALVVALLAVPIGFGVGIAVGSSEAGRLREQVDALTTESDELADELGETEESLAETEEENNSLQDELDEAVAALRAAKAKRPIPNFVGDDEDSVITFAEDLGWDVTVREQPTDEKPPGTVLSQDPRPGTVLRAGSTFTVTVATKPPPSWKDIAVFTGQGENTTRTFTLPDGKVRVVYSFSGNTNAAMTLYQRPRRYKDLLLNEIGDRSGETRLYFTGKGFYFEVCCGSWTIRLQEFR